MSRLKHLSWVLTAGLLTAGVAHGQTAQTSGQATSQTGATTNNPSTQVSSETSADASAQVDMQKLRDDVEKKSSKVSAAARARAEAQLEATSKQVEVTAEKHGEATVAERLGAEFGMSAQALTEERAKLNASWGQLMIAHTIAANSKSGVTAEQLIEMKRDNNMGWGKIASGLGLRLGSVISSVKAEGQVATGLAKPDGHVSPIRGEGARGGVAANAGIHGGLGNGNTNAGAGLGAGVGVKVGK